MECVQPPDVGVEDQVVDSLPVRRVLRDRARHDDPVLDAVHLRVVRVRLDQKRRPVKLHRRIVLLKFGRKNNFKFSNLNLFCEKQKKNWTEYKPIFTNSKKKGLLVCQKLYIFFLLASTNRLWQLVDNHM